jgi:hypothetical protein
LRIAAAILASLIAQGSTPARVPADCPRVSMTLASLVEAVKKSRLWDGESLVAIDVGEYTLELRRPNDRVGRAETPGERLSPALEDIRRRVFGLALADARPIAVPIEERWKCPATVWRDE